MDVFRLRGRRRAKKIGQSKAVISTGLAIVVPSESWMNEFNALPIAQLLQPGNLTAHGEVFEMILGYDSEKILNGNESSGPDVGLFERRSSAEKAHGLLRQLMPRSPMNERLKSLALFARQQDPTPGGCTNS